MAGGLPPVLGMDGRRTFLCLAGFANGVRRNNKPERFLPGEHVSRQAGKHQRPGAPELPRRSGPLFRKNQPEPVQAFGSVMTYRVCWGSGKINQPGPPKTVYAEIPSPTSPGLLRSVAFRRCVPP